VYREAGGSHRSKTFREFLFHGIDGGVNADKGHDTESDNGNCDACAQFVTPHGAERKGENVGYAHTEVVLRKLK
jgi:hypothetical protein